MRKIICNTSPLQYLHQAGRLDLLRALAGNVTVPQGVIAELDAGRRLGLDLPKPETLPWVRVETPLALAALPLARDLGEGESQVLALALEHGPDVVVILDDMLARQMAKTLRVAHVGTLGILVQAKAAGLIPSLAPILNQLDALGFRLAAKTRQAVLELEGE